MIKSQYSAEEVLAAMEAHGVLLKLMAETDGFRALHDNYTHAALCREVLRFMPDLESAWDRIPDKVRNDLDREDFFREVFSKYLRFDAGLSLTGEDREVAARIARDYSPGEYPFGDGSEYPVYLTSGTCEVTEQYDDLLDELDLDYGSFEGEFYPLTDDEAVFIGEDLADVADGYGALMGYSAVFKGEKFLMPSVEVGFGPDFGTDRDGALEAAKGLKDKIGSKIEAVGGHVFLDENHDWDRHVVQILIPFSYAKTVASDFDGWKTHLEQELLASTLTAEGPAAQG
jgi:hypothetical protein